VSYQLFMETIFTTRLVR